MNDRVAITVQSLSNPSAENLEVSIASEEGERLQPADWDALFKTLAANKGALQAR
jgi:hypothetical protein